MTSKFKLINTIYLPNYLRKLFKYLEKYDNFIFYSVF